MKTRLVVCFRYGAVGCAAEHYLNVAKRIDQTAVMVGGERVSWGSDRYAYEFDPDDFSLVLSRVLQVLLDRPEHGVGFSLGELCFGATPPWGPPLVLACALAGAAKPGEILLDPALPDVRRDKLATLGRIPVRVGDRHVAAALLLPGACPGSGYRSNPAPPSSTTTTAPPSIRGRMSVFDALRSGDAQTMLDLSRELRSREPNSGVGARLSAMALLTQGQTSEGVAQLRAERERARGEVPLQQAQACLALAVGLAGVGELHESALLSLEALGLARRCGNPRAEQASAQLLAQLAATSGVSDAARAWQSVSAAATAVKV